MPADWLQKLVKQGVISTDQLGEAEEMASNMGVGVADALVELGYVSGMVVAKAQAEAYGYDFINLDGREISPAVIELVPESVARENMVIPLSLEDDSLLVAVSDPMAVEVLDKLRFILNRDIKVAIAPVDAIQRPSTAITVRARPSRSTRCSRSSPKRLSTLRRPRPPRRWWPTTTTAPRSFVWSTW